MELTIPKVLNFGGTELVDISHLEKTVNVSRRTALKYLRALKIKPLYIGKDVYYSLSTFNKIMFILSKPGSPGFLFPGSSAKTNKELRKRGFLIEVTEEILTQAASPQTMAELAASTGTDTSMVKKLLSHENASARKEPK